MATTFDSALYGDMGDSGILGDLWGDAGLHPLVGVGVGGLTASLGPLLIRRLIPAGAARAAVPATATTPARPELTATMVKIRQYADEIGAGIGLAAGAAMYFGSEKTKEAGLAAMVAAVATGLPKIVGKQLDPPLAGYFGATAYQEALYGAAPVELLGAAGPGAQMELLGASDGSPLPQVDLLGQSFGSNFLTR